MKREVTSNLAFHLLQDVRDNLIGPISHKTDLNKHALVFQEQFMTYVPLTLLMYV